jgi:hypothetical protein
LEERLSYYLKTARAADAEAVDDTTGRQVLQRARHAGRKLVEVYVLAPDGKIDRFQERARRKLGSNAIASRTWLCETAEDAGGEWGDGRYVPEPLDAIEALPEPPAAIVLILDGAESEPQHVVAQLRALAPAR